MKKLTISTTFAVAMVALLAGCMEENPTDESVGGSGGASTSSSSGETGGSGGNAGDGPTARPCEDSGDCDGRNGVPICNVDVCVAGFCQVVFDAFGVFCGVPGEICDGKGQCGEWMPLDATTCYEATPKTPVEPLCDDGDPATYDDHVRDQNGDIIVPRMCANPPATEGFVCGPSYTIQAGKCCPAWMAETVP